MRNIGDTPILVVETLAIRIALKQTIQDNYTKVIIENDTLVAIQAITRTSILLKLICNNRDIIMLARNLEILVLCTVGKNLLMLGQIG